MVNVTYIVDNSKHILFLKGHAGYGEYGKDIVCAGISAIVQALIGWGEKHPNTVEYINISEGDVTISCVNRNDVKAVFDMAVTGIAGIANTYPENVIINILGITE